MHHVKDKNGKELHAGDFIKFTNAAGVVDVGRIAHLDTHQIPKLDKDGQHIQRVKKGTKPEEGIGDGVETEPQHGQVLHFHGNTTELAYFDSEKAELVHRPAKQTE